MKFSIIDYIIIPQFNSIKKDEYKIIIIIVSLKQMKTNLFARKLNPYYIELYCLKNLFRTLSESIELLISSVRIIPRYLHLLDVTLFYFPCFSFSVIKVNISNCILQHVENSSN